MAKISMIIFAVVLCMMLITPMHAQSMSCQMVEKSLAPCLSYLRNGGSVPSSCCSSIGSLNSAATTTPERRTVCQCLKAAAKTYNVNPQYAAALPEACDVNIGYPISYNTNCDNIQ